MEFKLTSPPIHDLGILPRAFESRLRGLGSSAAGDPRSRMEPGRVSTLVALDGATRYADDSLEQFAMDVGARFLGERPVRGSALLSVVTDTQTFLRERRTKKIAFDWHEEIEDTPEGLRRLSPNVTRILIPLDVGPLCATGELLFPDGVQVDSSTSRPDALKAGQTVFGPDGSLIRSVPDPQGGEIFRAEPGRVWNFTSTVHKGDADLFPDGRVSLVVDSIR